MSARTMSDRTRRCPGDRVTYRTSGSQRDANSVLAGRIESVTTVIRNQDMAPVQCYVVREDKNPYIRSLRLIPESQIVEW